MSASASASTHRTTGGRGTLTDSDDVERAVRVIAAGLPVAYGFANFYALASRSEQRVVRAMNLMKGRPADQVGSVTTSASRGVTLFDWTALPDGLSRGQVLDAVDVLFGLGPCGFRGPAAPHIPIHLTHVEHGVRTVQLIGPGYACPSRHFVARALNAVDRDFLYITSANRSHHRTGAADEPAHYRADALARDFADERGMAVLAHPDEAAARNAYPLHATSSVTVVSWATTAGHDADGRPVLVVERHGSLGVSDVAAALAPLGLAVALGPRADGRLQARRYA